MHTWLKGEREIGGRGISGAETLMECLFKNEAHQKDSSGGARACLGERWSPAAPWDI